jgi:hypothetical protein
MFSGRPDLSGHRPLQAVRRLICLGKPWSAALERETAHNQGTACP